jgi:hypothetical protein
MNNVYLEWAKQSGFIVTESNGKYFVIGDEFQLAKFLELFKEKLVN